MGTKTVVLITSMCQCYISCILHFYWVMGEHVLVLRRFPEIVRGGRGRFMQLLPNGSEERERERGEEQRGGMRKEGGREKEQR